MSVIVVRGKAVNECGSSRLRAENKRPEMKDCAAAIEEAEEKRETKIVASSQSPKAQLK
jgi:hypothetical protein